MSELFNTSSHRAIGRQLLSTVSVLALLTWACSKSEANSDDNADRPTIWIELGGQMENVSGQGESFDPAFLAANPNSPVLNPTTPLQAQKPPTFSFGEEGKISFQPENSDWVFSASARIGRSSNVRHVDHQTYKVFYVNYKYGVGTPNKRKFDEDFANTHASHVESQTVLDFSAGKDVGLGMFGSNTSSTLSFGLRFVQFASNATFDVRARPDLQIKHLPFPTLHATLNLAYFHTYHATGQAARNFHGVGPALSWSGSAPFAGNLQDGEVTFDWGANVALLFGRQKAHVRHHETGHYYSAYQALGGQYYAPAYTPRSGGHDTAKFVTVPNVGGFGGISLKWTNAKLSLGYRADFFFGAIDGGIDVAKSETVGFYGPFASISVGMGG